MEDENGLDLSLALPCGGCSWKSKTGRPSNVKAEEGDQRDWMKDDGSFFSNLSSKSEKAGHKRKSCLFGKSERDALYAADLLENTRTSNVSINEAEEGSTSYHDDSSKQCDSGYEDLTGKRRFIVSSDKEANNTQFSVPFLGQPVNILNMPYFAPLKDSSNPSIVPMMAAGYSPVMLPSLDNNNSFAPIPHFHQSYTRARAPLSINKDNESLKISQDVASQSSQYNGKAIEQVKSNHVTKEGCSFNGEENSKGSNIIFPGKRPSQEAQTDGSSASEFPPIRLGVAADLKFGGCGSSPDLPWVSTTAPNGKTISGVTYWFSPTQIKIVCACHGLHLSPDDFVLHASAQKTSQEASASFPGSNSAASDQN
ncbi:PREDICTED: ninja-family protein mc410-like [Ipomoea nil]|uniref:ninja-family protein mc410-like n=1 Tax=Ipomoea nil TaxID=35883 RepID=UPI000901F52B|nr:PREDICTED: ninja-family protein mc410-like [Ipomoea nil]XP_019192622.1 PREDICTED: ninja-family protein mc410-like [Ipomoea nil]